jgi:hypothetical protein
MLRHLVGTIFRPISISSFSRIAVAALVFALLSLIVSLPAYASKREANVYAYLATETQAAMSAQNDDELGAANTRYLKWKRIAESRKNEIGLLKSQGKDDARKNKDLTKTKTRLEREKSDAEVQRDAAIEQTLLILSDKDPIFAKRLEQIRIQGAQLAATPQGRACIDFLASDESLKAVRCMQDLAEVAAQTKITQNNLELANIFRSSSYPLALALNDGDISRDELIAHYEKIVALDPDGALECVQLVEQYIDAYQFGKAKAALKNAWSALMRVPDRYAMRFYWRTEILFHGLVEEGPFIVTLGPEPLSSENPLVKGEALGEPIWVEVADGPSERAQFNIAASRRETGRLKWELSQASMSDLPTSDMGTDLVCVKELLVVMGNLMKTGNTLASEAGAPCNAEIQTNLARHPRSLLWVQVDSFFHLSELEKYLPESGQITVDEGRKSLAGIQTMLSSWKTVRWLDQTSLRRDSDFAAYQGIAAAIACAAEDFVATQGYREEVEAHFLKLRNAGANGVVPRISYVDSSYSLLDCLLEKRPDQGEALWEKVWHEVSLPDHVSRQDFELRLDWIMRRYTLENDLKREKSASNGLTMLRSVRDDALKAWPNAPTLRWMSVLVDYQSGFWTGHPDGWEKAVAGFEAMQKDPATKDWLATYKNDAFVDDIRRRIAERNADAASKKAE